MTRWLHCSWLAVCACNQEAHVGDSPFATGGPDPGVSTTSADTSSSSIGPGDETGAAKLDVGMARDGGAAAGDEGNDACPCGNSEWSYIWIASGNDHLSKVDTRTMEVAATFVTHPPERAGLASRTSVSLDGTAAVVANRGGGLAKFWARSADCDENANGEPGLQTSTGVAALAWGEDDCLAWYTPFDVTTQRPVAWTGRFDTETCTYHDQKIWSASGYDGTESSIGASMCIGVTGDDAAAGNEVRVYRLDGQTGEVEDDVLVDGVACSGPGPYGMAADGDGNVWVSFFHSGELVRVDGSTLEVEIHSGANYGITVDSLDRPWS